MHWVCIMTGTVIEGSFCAKLPVVRQWFRFVHIGFFHVLIGANILLTRPDWFCLLDCHDKHRVLMGEPTICTSLLWVLEILNRHSCLLQRGR